jgi:hypothetical protein
MSYRETEHLRVLIATERKGRLELVTPIVGALGHEVMAREIEVEDVGPVTARERPDVGLVGLGESSEHALGLIDKIVRAAAPVDRAAQRPRSPTSSQRHPSEERSLTSPTTASMTGKSSIDIVLRSFTKSTTSKVRSDAAR